MPSAPRGYPASSSSFSAASGSRHNDGMVRTQIQLPDALYDEAKRVARERERSLAEVVRPRVEYITQVYPAITGGEPWSPPAARDLGPFNHGVTKFVTANTRHFEEFGFSRVWNPAAAAGSEPNA